ALRVQAREREVAQPELHVTHDLVGDMQLGLILLTLGQGEQLARGIKRGLVLAAQLVKLPEAPQNWEQLGGIARATQLAGPRVRPADFGSAESFGGAQRDAERYLKGELAPGALGTVGQQRQQLQRPVKVADRLDIRRAQYGLLARGLPV